MSAKPTPGPYMVCKADYFGGYVVRGADGVIAASFSAHDTEWVQAEANARAWVDGMAAMGLLERIQAVVTGYDDEKFSDAAAFFRIKDILDEAKT